MTREVVEGREEVFGNEEGFVREGERVEVVEGEGEQGRRGKQGGKAVVVMESL